MEGEIMSNKKQRRTNKFGIYLIYSLTFVSYISLCLFYEILPLLLDTDKFNQSKRNKNPNMISFQSAVFIILTSSGFLIYRRLKSNPKVLLIFANILIAFPFRLLSSILVEVAGCDEIDLKIIVHSIEFILRWTIHLSNKPHNMQVLTSVSALLFALMEFTVYLQASISLILYYLGNLMFMVVFAVLYERYSELCSMIIFKNALNKVKQGVFIIDKNSFSPLYCNSYISDIIEMKYSNFQNSGNLALNDMPTETSSFVTSILKNLDLKKNLLSRDPSSTNGKILQKFIAFVIFSIYEISMSESLREFFIQNEAKIDQELNALNLSSNDDPISEQALSLLDSIVNIIVSDYESSYSLPIDEDQNSKSFVKIGSFAFELADFQDDRKIILNKVLSRSDKRNFSSGNFNVDSLLFYDLSIYVDEQNMIHFQVKSINKEKELEVEKKKLETKILFLSKIVHEFKNPLITIGTLCDLIADGKEKLDFYNSSALPSLSKFPSSQSTNSNELKYLSSLSDYLMFLVEDLNVFAKAHLKSNEPLYNKDHKSHAALKEVDLISCLDFSINIYKFRQKYDDNKKQLKIVSDIHPNLYKTFITNETKLKQVIINILSNAYKFTTCGRITLRAENYKEEDSMDAQLNKPKLGKTTENLITKRKAIKISISDTGNGMSKEEIDSLFKPFTTLERNIEQNTHGSGLGLLIIQEFLNEMNSELQIESKLNEGSTFSFVLTEPIRADGMFKQTSKESKSSLKNSSDISFVTCNSDSNDSLYLENVFHKSLLNLMNNINSNPVKQRTSSKKA